MSENSSIPTVKEVAARCGVSQATVSRVLNQKYEHGFSVREELKQRILEVAEELGYRPNLAARNLVRKQTKIVAMLGCKAIFGWPGNLYPTIIDAAVQALHTRNYDVCISVPKEDDNSELPAWKIDGAIVLQECTPDTFTLMERANLPYVVVNGVGGSNSYCVIPDDVQGTERAMSHLLDLGHIRIAYAGPTVGHREHKSIEDRHNTYLLEMARHGLEPIPGHDKMFGSATAFLAMAVHKHRATAVLAYDHIEALKLIHGSHMLGLQIPEQLSLICFNDEYLSEIVTPPLTTIAVPPRKIGRLAAEILLSRLESPETYQYKVRTISQDLTVRGSTSPPLKE